MQDVCLNTTFSQPSRQPEPVAPSLKGERDTADRPTGLLSFAAPAREQIGKRRRIGIEFLEGLRSTPGTVPATSQLD
jgi:hypothetical protein